MTVIVLASLVSGASLYSAEPEVQDTDMPRVPPTEADRALSTFTVKPGFKMELVAAEPLIVDPITIAFDEDGRLYALEMRDYSERRDEKMGRVRLLEDTDGDGRMDKSTVFAEGLAWPTALACFDGGVFVAATPDVFYLKDINGDGKADIQRVALTGFGTDVSPPNVQALVNSLAWTLENRIEGASGGNGGTVLGVSLRGRDFSFEPKSLGFRPETGGGQYGWAFDSLGRKFVCSNSAHIRQVIYSLRYLTDGMAYSPPPATVDIPVDGAAAEVFRRSPEEPWRVIRTRWRVSGLVPGLVEGGGRSSGYFTGATGLTIYTGDALGPDFADNAFIGDAGSNLVHRKKVSGTGVQLSAERPADEQKSEFVASTDNWFRPVQIANGPDGALYIVDMYREVIEHPWSLPPPLKKHLDLNSGNDRGRIYRVVPGNFKRRPPLKLSKATAPELAQSLENANGWTRMTAARLLYERQDASSVAPLRAVAKDSPSPLGRMHALYALASLRALDAALLSTALTDADAAVRMHALRLAENTPGSYALGALAEDPSPLVRFQLAWTLIRLRAPDRWEILSKLLRREDDPWVSQAALAAASIEPQRVLAQIKPEAWQNASTLRLIEIAVKRGGLDAARAILEELRLATAPRQLAVTASALRGLGRDSEVLADLRTEESLREAADTAERYPSDPNAPTVLAAAGRDDVLLQQLKANLPASTQVGIVEALLASRESRVRESLIESWPALSELARGRALTSLLQHEAGTRRALEAARAGAISPRDFSLFQVDQLRKSSNQAVRELAIAVFGPIPSITRADAVARLLPAAQMTGVAGRGREYYLQRCATCHRLKGEGTSVGPDLESVRQAGREMMLTHLADPNREVAPRFAATEIETTGGESLSGIVLQESPTEVLLQLPSLPPRTLARSAIAKMTSLPRSLMPEGLEEGLSLQQVADLLEYVLAP